VSSFHSTKRSFKSKFFTAFLCFFLTLTLLHGAPPLYFSLNVPLSLQRSIQGLVEQYAQELDSLWGLPLTFPIRVDIQKEAGLSVRGEATFDGNLYTVFMNPSFLDIPYLLKHEMMHLYTFEWMWRTKQIMDDGAEQMIMFESVPLWVMEGLAVWYEDRLREDARSVFPWEYRSLIDFMEIEDYPKGEAHAQYYTILSDFFRGYDQRGKLKENFREALRFVEAGDQWADAFTKATGYDFQEAYTRWKQGKIFTVWLSVFFNLLAAGIPLFLIFFLFIIFLRKREPIDTFGPEYEKRYGPFYWMKPEKERPTTDSPEEEKDP